MYRKTNFFWLYGELFIAISESVMGFNTTVMIQVLEIDEEIKWFSKLTVGTYREHVFLCFFSVSYMCFPCFPDIGILYR